MAVLIGYSYDTKLAVFSIHSADELDQLPTTHDLGNVSGVHDTIVPNSRAILDDGSGDSYVLDAEDNWNVRA